MFHREVVRLDAKEYEERERKRKDAEAKLAREAREVFASAGRAWVQAAADNLYLWLKSRALELNDYSRAADGYRTNALRPEEIETLCKELVPVAQICADILIRQTKALDSDAWCRLSAYYLANAGLTADTSLAALHTRFRVIHDQTVEPFIRLLAKWGYVTARVTDATWIIWRRLAWNGATSVNEWMIRPPGWEGVHAPQNRVDRQYDGATDESLIAAGRIIPEPGAMFGPFEVLLAAARGITTQDLATVRAETGELDNADRTFPTADVGRSLDPRRHDPDGYRGYPRSAGVEPVLM
jgi:hypothetical protein